MAAHDASHSALAKATAAHILPLSVILKRIARQVHQQARHRLDARRNHPGAFVVLHIPGSGDSPSDSIGPSPSPPPPHSIAVVPLAHHEDAALHGHHGHGLHPQDLTGDAASSHDDIIYIRVPEGGSDTMFGSQFSIGSVLDGEHIDEALVPDINVGSDWFFHQRAAANVLTSSSKDGVTPSVSIFNLLNATVACGSLGLPLAFSLMGYGLATAVLLAMMLVNVATVLMLVRVGLAEGTRSYDLSVRTLLGDKVLHCFQALLIMGQAGAMLSYIVLLGDFSVSVLEASINQSVDRRVCIAVLVLLVALPLCLLRKLSSLQFTGMLSVLFVVFFVVALLVRACQAHVSTGAMGAEPLQTSFIDFFNGLTIFAFAFSNQTAVMPVFGEMRQKTIGSFFKVASVTFGVAFLIYLVAGLSGYLRFGSTVSGNVLMSFPSGAGQSTDKLMGVVSACFLFVAVFTIPMMNFPIRVSLHYILYGETKRGEVAHVIESVLPLGAALLVAMVVTDVGLVFSFVGSVSAATTSFILPALLFLKSTKVAKSGLEVLGAFAILAIGLVTFVAGIISAVKDASG